MVDVETILRQQAQAESDRSTWDAHWLEVAERLLPRQADFLGANSMAGAKRTHRIFDETGQLALDTHTNLMEGMLIPRSSIWHGLEPEDRALLKIKRVAEWYQAVNERLFRLRYAPKSGFTGQIHESFQSLGAFGNQALWIDGLRDGGGKPSGLFYRSIHISELSVRTNFQGRVDSVYRKFSLDARQAVQMFGDRAPPCAQKAIRENKPTERAEYVHCLMPRADYDPARLDGAGMPIASLYIAVKDKLLLEESGYRKMPLVYSRYETAPNEDYGRGPGMKALPAVKACQAMMQSLGRGVQLALEPPMGGPDDDAIANLAIKPNGYTPGAVNRQGERLVQPLFDQRGIAEARELLEATRALVKEGFLAHLLDVGEELKSHVSAAAIMQKAGEKGLVIAPIMGRQETELLDPMVEREVDVMAQMGLLDDMPPEVRESGGAFRTRYENPLARMQRSEQAAGFFRTIEASAQIAAVRPDVFDNIDFDVAIRDIADIQGMPAKWMASLDAVKATRDDRQQQANTAQAIEAAPQISGAIKDVAQANAAGGAA